MASNTPLLLTAWCQQDLMRPLQEPTRSTQRAARWQAPARNPPLDGNEEAGYGFAYNPPYELPLVSMAALAFL
jgi:hypothetical protein